MADKTGIEWTDATWNPVTGCSKVSQGCKHCYAERDWARLAANPATKYFSRAFTDVATHRDTLALPCRWSKPRRIFVNSMSDLFHEAVPYEFIAAVFGAMAAASWHTFQVLTKRPQRALDFFAWIDAHPERADFDSPALQKKYPGADWRPFFLVDLASRHLPLAGHGLRCDLKGKWPLPNVQLGVSVEDQTAADDRVPLLLKMPAAVRFLSVEPMLGPVYIEEIPDPSGGVCLKPLAGLRWIESGNGRCETMPLGARIDWVITGAESGPHARPSHPDWFRSVYAQCASTGIAYLHKQNGEWIDSDTAQRYGPDVEHLRGKGGVDIIARHNTIFYRVGKKAAGRLLDGVEHNGYPEVRE